MSDFTLKKVPPIKCKHCGKQRGDHRATTFECPKGTKGRAGTYNMWGPEVFEPKPQRAKP